MSYRTVKRLLGETSLERKSRYLFGGSLLLLITASFYVYARLTSDLVNEQNPKQARRLIYPILLEKHIKELEPTQTAQSIQLIIDDMRPEELEYKARFFKPDVSRRNSVVAEPEFRPSDAEDYDAVEAIVKDPAAEYPRVDKDSGEYQFFAGIKALKTCVQCHRETVPSDAKIKAGDLMRVVKITLPLKATREAVARNNAILLATAIGTAFLAMLAAYAIVRYVIVKPVLHLKDVSDQVARGNLEQRADIRTGDEFEELSHAFNRMLRHLVAVQDELRAVNTDLDGKVDQLAQVNLRLYEMNKLKDDFLATMSHELRTPLNSILGFSDLLGHSDNITDRQKRFVQNIQTSGHNLMAMINDLLDLAKIESGRMEIQIVECSLGDLVERQVSSLNPLAEKKNIDLSFETDPQIPLLVQDSVKIQQILDNLLSNAIKFTPEGGRVRIRATRVDDVFFEIVVEDTGIGIPLNEQAMIFEKFRQGHTVPGQKDVITREYGGTGLGLSIVKELSKLLGGEVSVVSEFGKGSTFTVRLPMRLDERPVAASDSLTSAHVGLNRLTSKLLDAPSSSVSAPVEAPASRDVEAATPAPAHADA
ncbi:MAG TPA: ATP-binding protein [Planctomycetaceae bacterium]|jgi:signal transduction histidine kinase|nr:ATP-binding protein [Planctomycetaceae bacterium]